MATSTPTVRHQQLFLPNHDTPLCLVDSPAWFAWLATAHAFRFCASKTLDFYRGSGPTLLPISLRKESRRQGHFWYAYRRQSGRLHKRYAGRSEQLTLETLIQLANLLYFCDDP